MINDLKHKVNKEVLLRNVEIVEDAISTYLNNKSYTDTISTLENFAKHINDRIINLPINRAVGIETLRIEMLPCIMLDQKFLKQIEGIDYKDSKTNNFKNYIIDEYNELNSNFCQFLGQDFKNLGYDKSFVEKVEKGLNSIELNDRMSYEFYNKTSDKLRIMQIIQFNWQEKREFSFRDEYKDDYWNENSLSSDFSRSALSDLQWLKTQQRDEDTRIKW